MRKTLWVFISFVFVCVRPTIPQQQHDDDFLVYVAGIGPAEPIVKALKKKMSAGGGRTFPNHLQ
jgi:hypothetical protein